MARGCGLISARFMAKSTLFIVEIAILVLLGFISSEVYLLKKAQSSREDRLQALVEGLPAPAAEPKQDTPPSSSAESAYDAFLPPPAPVAPEPSADALPPEPED